MEEELRTAASSSYDPPRKCVMQTRKCSKYFEHTKLESWLSYYPRQVPVRTQRNTVAISLYHC